MAGRPRSPAAAIGAIVGDIISYAVGRYGGYPLLAATYAARHEADILIIFSQSGMDGFFRELSRPAAALELPAGRVGPPDTDRMRRVGATYGIEFAPAGTTSQDMKTLP